MSNAIRLYLIILVSAVWAISLIAPIVRPEYQPAPEINVAFMAIITVLTTTLERENKQKKQGNNKEEQVEGNGEGGDKA